MYSFDGWHVANLQNIFNVQYLKKNKQYRKLRIALGGSRRWIISMLKAVQVAILSTDIPHFTFIDHKFTVLL